MSSNLSPTNAAAAAASVSGSAMAELQHVLRIPVPGMVEERMIHNPVAVAHAALQALRDSGDSQYLFLRTVMEMHTDMAQRLQFLQQPQQQQQQQQQHQVQPFKLDEELLFHCVTGVRQVILWQWKKHYSITFLRSLRDYFMLLGHVHNGSNSSSNSGNNNYQYHSSRTVQLACYTTAVAFWKRGWKEEDEKDNGGANQQQDTSLHNPEREHHLLHLMSMSLQALAPVFPMATAVSIPNKSALFQYLESQMDAGMQMLQQQNNPQQQSYSNYGTLQRAVLFLNCLVQEFSGKSAVSYRLPLEFHKDAHRAYERGADIPITSTSTSAGGSAAAISPLFRSLQLAMKGLSFVVSTMNNSSSSNDGAQQPSSPTSSLSSSYSLHNGIVAVASAVVQLTMDCIGWEFGLMAWDNSIVGASLSARTILRPPVQWREYLARPDFMAALFHLHHAVMTTASTLSSSLQQHQQQHQRQEQQANADLAHLLRQLLLQMASLSGVMFADKGEKTLYASHLLQGTLQLLYRSSPAAAAHAGTAAAATTAATATATTAASDEEESPELLDTLQMIGRIISNFKLGILVELPTLIPLLQGLTVTGKQLLLDQVAACEAAGGDVEWMEHGEWREEALTLLLDCAVLLASDPFLLYTGTEESRKSARQSLSSVLGPLYEGFVHCRTRMAALEEHHAVSQQHENGSTVDEVREDIHAEGLQEEMTSVSTIGRLNLAAALSCLSNMFGQTLPQLQSLWEGTGTVTAETAALLEQSRLLTMYICHLLTDNNNGESPSIPTAVIVACEEQPPLHADIASAVQALFQFADAQVHKIAENPANVRLSPLLAQSFLWFLHRWAPAYIFPADYKHSNTNNSIILEWSSTSHEKAQHAITMCISLCLYYQCYWPHEVQVQEKAGILLQSLAERGEQVRALMVASPVFHQMVRFHCLTAGIRHSAPQQEFEAAVRAMVGDGGGPMPSSMMNMVWGYQRLAYPDKARFLTAIIVACSDSQNPAATAMLTDSLKAVHDAFTSLVHALASNQVRHDDVNAKEMAHLCADMFCGVARASSMAEHERIPQFVTPYLSQLSGLMAYYATDLTVCEALLRFFGSYSEQFVAILDYEQSMALFQASAELLKSYSAHHCSSRVITRKSSAEAEAEEEQTYSDILAAIQLLINLGTKDFIDVFATQSDNPNQKSIKSEQVTDMIFFGLQQILPLMTQGLLQFPTLCSQFFDLVGFMMDTYPDKVSALPYDLFNALLESLLFGMTHHNPDVAKCSLHGIAGIAKEHLKLRVLNHHLASHPDTLDKCSRRLLTEVIFQSIVMDRIEAAGMALLPLAACDVHRFAAVVTELCHSIENPMARTRLQAAFTKLLKPEVLEKIAKDGNEGRVIRMQFKEDFQDFVNDVQSFLSLK